MQNSFMTASRYATAATKVDPKDVPEGIARDQADRVYCRTVDVCGPYLQYLCLYEDGNCMASARSLDDLVLAVNARLAYARKKPEDYDSELAGLGLSFDKSAPGSVVMHEVRSPTGGLLGISDLRDEAISMAVSFVLASRDPKTLSVEQFSRTCFFAPVTSLGRHGAVFDGDTSAMRELADLARMIWRVSPPAAAVETTAKQFIRDFVTGVLRSRLVQKGDSDFVHLTISTEVGSTFNVILSRRGHSRQQAVALLHASLTQNALAA